MSDINQRETKEGSRASSDSRERECTPAGDEDLLRNALALPRELDPPRGIWSAVEARVETKRRRSALVRRGVTAGSMLLAAAAVMLSIRAAKRPAVASRGGPTAASESVRPATAPEAVQPLIAPDEPMAVVVPEEASYREARFALYVTFAERAMTLPEKDRGKVGASLEAIDAAIQLTRTSLLEHPDDADLRAELDAEYEQKIDAMNDVLEWTTTRS